MSIFPFMDGYLKAEKDKALPMCREIAMNFDTGQMVIENGEFKVVEGVEAVKVWVYNALNTERFRHIIYTWDYGQELGNLVGLANYAELVKAKAQRYIRECLEQNPYIRSVYDIAVKSEGAALTIDLKLDTIYGSGEVSVNANI